MTPAPTFARRAVRARRQRGATLFTAMMLLILLTLLALSVAQVTGLQERMAGLYRADQQAFQSAEDQLRQLENSLLGNPAACDSGYVVGLPTSWRNGSTPNAARVENLNRAGASGGPRVNPLLSSARAGLGRTPGGPNCLVFRISSLQPDRPTDATTTALVQSIFVP